MPDQARIEVEQHDDATIVRVFGEVDIANIDAVRRDLEGAVNPSSRRHIIDLSPTAYMDSVGIGLLFSLGQLLNVRRQSLLIVSPQDSPVRRLLSMVAMHDVIPLADDVPAALAIQG